VGGALASLAVVLDTSVGWRGTHMLVGGSGLVVALLSATLMGPDPRPSRVKAEVKADEAVSSLTQYDTPRCCTAAVT
jgi:predicted MFS family arabinose efflux permease